MQEIRQDKTVVLLIKNKHQKLNKMEGVFMKYLILFALLIGSTQTYAVEVLPEYEIIALRYGVSIGGYPRFGYGAIKIDRIKDVVYACGVSNHLDDNFKGHCRLVKEIKNIKNSKFSVIPTVSPGESSYMKWLIDVRNGNVTFCSEVNKCMQLEDKE